MSIFHWIADYVLEEETASVVEITEFESGKEQRRRKHLKPRRSWRLSFPSISKTEAIDIETFFKAQKGGYDTFDWECPINSITYTVRFANDVFSYQRITDNVYQTEITLVEVI